MTAICCRGTSAGSTVPVRQDLNDISYSEIMSNKVDSYNGAWTGTNTNVNSVLPLPNIVPRLTTGWGISSVWGSVPVTSVSDDYNKLLIGTYTQDSVAYCLDTKGKTIQQYLGLKFLTTTLTNIVADTTSYMLNTYKNSTTVDETNSEWFAEAGGVRPTYYNPNWQSPTPYLGGKQSVNRQFSGTIKISYGSVPGNLRFPSNAGHETNPRHIIFVAPQPPGYIFGSYGYGFPEPAVAGFESDVIYTETRHKAMMDAMTNGTILGTITVNPSMFPDGRVPVPSQNLQVADGVGLPDCILNGLPGLSIYQPNVGEIIYIKVEVNCTPGNIQSVFNLKDYYEINKIGPNLRINYCDGFSTTNLGVSNNDTNSAIKKFYFGGIEVDSQNRVCL